LPHEPEYLVIAVKLSHINDYNILVTTIVSVSHSSLLFHHSHTENI